MRTVANQQQVVCGCRRAQAAGVAPGFSLAYARALLPPRDAARLIVADHQSDAEARALRALAIWANRFSPRVAVDPPDGLLLDITGCDRLFRGEDRLADQLHAAITRLGFAARFAIAPTIGAAWAFARFGDERAGRIKTAIDDDFARLPLCALRLADETITSLRAVGVRQIGDLLPLREQLPARFPDALERLDQATGRAFEWLTPVYAATPIRETFEFDGPTTDPAALHAITRRLLAAITATLRRKGLCCRTLKLTATHVESDPTTLTLDLAAASNAERHLWRLLRPRLERFNAREGVEQLRLRAEELHPETVTQQHAPQLGGDARRPPPARIGELVDVLASRLDRCRVVSIEPVATYIPERMYRYLAELPRPPRAAPMPRDRPLLLLEHPEPVQVHALAPDGPIAQFRWRGASYTVRGCRGPERICSEWWRDAPGERDYFHVQSDAGQHFWLFRAARSRTWRLHGLWV